MDLRDHLRLMARYNVWAHRRLLAAAEPLSDAAYRASTGLFFGSVHGSLNHLLVSERIWHSRLTGQASGVTALDQIIEEDRQRLASALIGFAEGWLDWIDAEDDAALAGDFHYSNLKGQPFCLPRASVPLHVFNHATHHRGQISTALSQAGLEAPVMDLPYFLLELPAGDWRRASS
jgi:uncharacterized damage-inducible protein DinB